MRLRTLTWAAVVALAVLLTPLLLRPTTVLGQAPRPPIKVGLFPRTTRKRRNK
jgi:hypothetical protein